MVLENAWIEVITFIRHAKANNCTCRSIKILFRASQEDSLLLYEDTLRLHTKAKPSKISGRSWRKSEPHRFVKVFERFKPGWELTWARCCSFGNRKQTLHFLRLRTKPCNKQENLTWMHPRSITSVACQQRGNLPTLRSEWRPSVSKFPSGDGLGTKHLLCFLEIAARK